MAIDVGGISYSVDIETSGVMAAQKEATSATSAIGSSMDKMAAKIDSLISIIGGISPSMSKASESMSKASSSMESLASSMKKEESASSGVVTSASEVSRSADVMASKAEAASAQMTKSASAVQAYIAALKIEAATVRMSAAQKEAYILAARGATAAQLNEIAALRGHINSLNSASGSNNKFRGGVQQAGYQLQDFIVQVQGGQSALVAFSQQGSQMAGIFGPAGAVFGAIIAITSVIIQMAMAAQGGARDLTELANAGNRIADLRLDTLVKINDASRDFASSDRISKYKQLGENVLSLTTEYENQGLATKRLREEVQKAQDAMQDIGGFFGKSQAEATADLAAKNAELTASLKQEAAVRSKVQGIQNQMAELTQQEANEKANLAKETKKTEQIQIKSASNVAKTEEQKAREAAASHKKALDDRRANLDEYYKWSTDAAQKNRDLKSQVDPMANASINYENQLAALQEAKQKELITEQTFNEQKEALANQYEQNRLAAAEQIYKSQSDANAFIMDSIDALGQASTSTISGLLSGTMSVTEAMQNFANVILNQAVGALVDIGIQYVKNQILGQTMQAAQIATAAATGTAMAAAYAPAAAMASLASFGANAAPAAAGITSTVATSNALALSGMRQYGGQVSADGMYRINETGAPEIFKNSSGQQYMLPNSKGEVISNSDATSGSGVNWSINVINNASDQVQVSQSVDNDQRIVNLAISAVSSQLASRTGQVSAGLQRGYNVNGRTR